MNLLKAKDTLLSAITAGDTKKVREMLSENPIFRGKEGVIGLPFCMEAASLGHHEIFELLIKTGVHPNSWVTWTCGRLDWCTLLHLMAEYASPCQENHIKIGEILIRLGADLEVRDYGRKTPLEYALYLQNMDWAEFLLKNGAKIDSLNLRWVFRNVNSRKDALELLFKHGLDPGFQNKNGLNLFGLFGNWVKKDHDDVAEVMRLLVNSRVSFYSGRKNLSLLWAVRTDNIQMVKFLLDELGFQVNQRDCGCQYALDFAVKFESLEMVNFLLSRGANVNREYRNENSPLIWAVAVNRSDVANLLISKGADVNAKNISGETPLHYACGLFNKEIIDLLVQKGAAISVEDQRGDTALSRMGQDHWTGPNVEVLKIIIKELAKLRFEKESISIKDVNLIQENQQLREYFEKCLAELKKMADTRFYGVHTYYAVLKMSKNLRKLAKLMKNKELVEKFEANLDKFTLYQSDLRRIFEEAEEVKNRLEAVSEKLFSIFYYYLPDVVLRKLVDYDVENSPSE